MLTKSDLIKIGSVVEGKFDIKVKGYKDEVLGFKEEVLGEILKLRDEVSVSQPLIFRLFSLSSKLALTF